MKTAAVAIDDWKLQTFKKHLDAAGYSWTVGPGVTHDTLILSVKFEWVRELKQIIEAANAECANERRT